MHEAAITGAAAFNSTGLFTVFDVVDSNDFYSGPTATGGLLFGTTDRGFRDIIDPDFRAGANGFLLAEVDYNVIGVPGDTTSIDLSGTISIALAIELSPSFASGVLTVGVAVPEPSSVILLILGAAGMVARRRSP